MARRNSEAIKKMFKGRNFMTPDVEECDFFDNGRAYEISTGNTMTNMVIVGVTISGEDGYKFSKSFPTGSREESLSQARTYVNQLKTLFKESL